MEKAELMTKISFLQGERRGQENLKSNLIRRIKMLEVALKQERVKYHKLKFGSESSGQNELKLPTTNQNENDGKRFMILNIGSVFSGNLPGKVKLCHIYNSFLKKLMWRYGGLILQVTYGKLPFNYW